MGAREVPPIPTVLRYLSSFQPKAFYDSAIFPRWELGASF